MNGRRIVTSRPRAGSSALKAVLVRPGCSAVEVTPVPSSRLASSYANITLASFDWLYACDPEYFCSPIRSLKLTVPIDLSARRHGHDAGGGARHEPVQQEVRQQERREMVEGKRVLEPIGGHVTVGPEAADVVKQDIEPRVRGEDLVSQPSDLGLGRHVGDEDINSRIARLLDDRGGGHLGALPDRGL